MRYNSQNLRFSNATNNATDDDINMTLAIYDKDSVRKQRNARTHGRKRDEERRDRRNNRWDDE